jgi:integrase/recombinase XerD
MTHKRQNTPNGGTERASRMTLRALQADFVEELEIRGRSALTAQRYDAYTRTFTDWLAARLGKDPASLESTDVDAETLRQYRLYLARRRDPADGHVIGAGTRNLYCIALRNFLKYCSRRNHNVPDPEEHLELAKVRDLEVRHLERAEVGRIAAAVRPDSRNGLRDRALIEVLFGTGVRVSELAAMRRRQVNLDRREGEVVGKGGRSRLVLLTKDAAHWARRYLESRSDTAPWLFVSNRKDAEGVLRALSVRQIQKVVDAAAKRAGIPFRVSPHWFRHGRLTVVARHLGVEAAQRVAGHASLATTSRYLHVTNRTLREGYDEAERREGGN